MSTFIQKVRVVTLGAAHDLLDKAIDLNSPSALRQYTRDLEDALDKMNSEAAIQQGQVRTLEREIGDLTSKIATTKTSVQQLLVGGHEDLARPKATDILRMQDQLDKDTKDLVAQKAASASIDLAVTQIQAKHDQMVARVRELERLDRDSKAKEQTAAALVAAGRLVNSGADVSVDDVESKMRERNDVASTRFDRAMGDVSIKEDPEQAAKVDDLLKELQPTKSVGAGK